MLTQGTAVDRAVLRALKEEMYRQPLAALRAGGLGFGGPPVGRLAQGISSKL